MYFKLHVIYFFSSKNGVIKQMIDVRGAMGGRGAGMYFYDWIF